MNRFLHRLAHLLGLEVGHAEMWLSEDGVMVGWRCATCDRLDHVARRRDLDDHDWRLLAMREDRGAVLRGYVPTAMQK